MNTGTAENPEVLPPRGSSKPQGDDAELPALVERAVGTHEIAAVAAEAEAEVKARVALAIARPRNEVASKKRILEACRRPEFADLATWERPVGKSKNEATGEWEEEIGEGPSIRLAEECMRAWGNIYITVRAIFESDEIRVIRVGGMDLESNASETQDFTLRKTTEKRKASSYDTVLKVRENAKGDKTFVVAAHDGAVRSKERAEISKVKRGLILQLLPSDIVQEAFQLAKATAAEADATQTAQRRDQCVAVYARLKVTQEQLEQVMGKPKDAWTPEDLGKLRQRHSALLYGEMDLAEFLGAAAKPTEAQATQPGQQGVAGLKAEMAAKKASASPASDAKGGA